MASGSLSQQTRFYNSKDAMYKAIGNYSSFAGVDMVASITIPLRSQELEIKGIPAGKASGKTYIIGNLQTLSISTHTDKIPVRALGFRSPKGFTSGHRTYAGTLIFAVFDKYALHDIRQELLNMWNTKSVYYPKSVITPPNYLMADSLPPFDITMTVANEYGQMCTATIKGITIVDDGMTISIDDLMTEQTMTYQALAYKPLIPIYINPGNTIFTDKTVDIPSTGGIA